MLKLNLGCGSHLLEGFVNVDKFAYDEKPISRHLEPCVTICDLESLPWPWLDNEAEEVVFRHSLEHMGEHSSKFLDIMQELYRVCAPDAKITIVFPPPTCGAFWDDPTHVRPLTPEMFLLFSKKENLRNREKGYANSPLALQLGVDFEVLDVKASVSKETRLWHQQFHLPEPMNYLSQHYFNVVSEFTVELKAIKPQTAEQAIAQDIFNTANQPSLLDSKE